jgi:hypothetical protein
MSSAEMSPSGPALLELDDPAGGPAADIPATARGCCGATSSGGAVLGPTPAPNATGVAALVRAASRAGTIPVWARPGRRAPAATARSRVTASTEPRCCVSPTTGSVGAAGAEGAAAVEDSRLVEVSEGEPLPLAGRSDAAWPGVSDDLGAALGGWAFFAAAGPAGRAGGSWGREGPPPGAENSGGAVDFTAVGRGPGSAGVAGRSAGRPEFEPLSARPIWPGTAGEAGGVLAASPGPPGDRSPREGSAPGEASCCRPSGGGPWGDGEEPTSWPEVVGA